MMLLLCVVGDIMPKDEHGWTVLHAAAQYGRQEILGNIQIIHSRLRLNSAQTHKRKKLDRHQFQLKGQV